MIIYALTDNSKIVYVGLTVNVNKRINEHSRSKQFDSYLIIDANGNREIEYLCIKELNPYYNNQQVNLKFEIARLSLM